MYETFIRDRITDLRIKKNISEYKMSRDLGHSNSYMHSISSGKALPSLTEFLYICEYLGITPKEFFSEDITEPMLVDELYQETQNLDSDDLTLLLDIARRLRKK